MRKRRTRNRAPKSLMFSSICTPRRSFPLHCASQIASVPSILVPGCPRHQFGAFWIDFRAKQESQNDSFLIDFRTFSHIS